MLGGILFDRVIKKAVSGNENRILIWIRIYNIKWNTKVKKSKKKKFKKDNFLGNYAASDVKKARFCTVYLFKLLNMVWIRFRILIQNRNFFIVGNGTAINRYGSATLK